MENPNPSDANSLEILDLTKVLDVHLEIYTSGDYSDPPLHIDPWCTIQEQGYQVSRLQMGTQTGTHIDAPAHFVADGATLEALPLQALMGRYVWVDLTNLQVVYQNEPVLFLTSSDPAMTTLSEEAFEALLQLPCKVWVIVYGVRVIGRDPFYFHQALAKAGKYLIEDVDEATAQQVKVGGEIIAFPLRLTGVSGSPCRVVIAQNQFPKKMYNNQQ